MISYEDLCAALDRYTAARGRASAPAPSTPVVATLQRPAAAPIADYATDDHTSISTALPPAEDDHEVELGDVLSDEESQH